MMNILVIIDDIEYYNIMLLIRFMFFVNLKKTILEYFLYDSNHNINFGKL